MLQVTRILQDWTPITNLCRAAIAKLGAPISPDQISSDVAVVLVKRGCLVPGSLIKEAFVIEIARRCTLAALRNLENAPLPLFDDVLDTALESTSPMDGKDAEELFNKLLNSRPRTREVERSVRELMMDAIARVFSESSPRDQALVVQRLVNARSLGEIAEAFNLKKNTTSRAISTFKEKVRTEYVRLRGE